MNLSSIYADNCAFKMLLVTVIWKKGKLLIKIVSRMKELLLLKIAISDDSNIIYCLIASVNPTLSQPLESKKTNFKTFCFIFVLQVSLLKENCSFKLLSLFENVLKLNKLAAFKDFKPHMLFIIFCSVFFITFILKEVVCSF